MSPNSKQGDSFGDKLLQKWLKISSEAVAQEVFYKKGI